MYNKTVGIYHVFSSNRSALMEELENDEMNFTCEEITDIGKINNVESDVIVIFSPAFLTVRMSLSEIQDILMESDKTLLIVAYDINIWRLDRTRTFYVKQKDNRQTVIDVKTILAMVMTDRQKNNVLDTENLS